MLGFMRYDDDVEKSLEAANLTKEERAEVWRLKGSFEMLAVRWRRTWMTC